MTAERKKSRLWVMTDETGRTTFSFDEPTARTKAFYSRKGRSCVLYLPHWVRR